LLVPCSSTEKAEESNSHPVKKRKRGRIPDKLMQTYSLLNGTEMVLKSWGKLRQQGAEKSQKPDHKRGKKKESPRVNTVGYLEP